jgi:hypothetical protein
VWDELDRGLVYVASAVKVLRVDLLECGVLQPDWMISDGNGKTGGV